MKELNQAIEQLLIQLHGIWIRRRYVIITAWLICPAAWFAIYKMPPVYQADARVYFDTQSILEPLLRGLTVNRNAEMEVQALARLVLTRPNLENVARKTDLGKVALSSKDFEKVVDDLEKSIKLTVQGGRREVNIYTVSYENSDPQLALKVVQEMLSVFIETRLGTNRSDQLSAERFITAQIEEYERRLIEAERKRSEFRRNQMTILEGGEANYYNRISQAEAEKSSAELEIQQLQQRIISAKRDINELTSLGGEGRAPSTQFDARIAEVRSTLSTLKLRFTENHPDVVEFTRLLEQLEQQRKDEIALLKETGGMSETNAALLMQSPLYQSLVTSISSFESEIVSKKILINKLEETIQTLRNSLHLIPQVEAEFAALNRDYDTNRAQYETLLSRRESAEMARKVDSTESEGQFRVIDPPRVPMLPSGPKRLVFYTLALFAGIGAGVGMAFLRNLLSPVLTSAAQLRSISAFPVFGVVSHTNKKQIQKVSRTHLFYFIMLSGMLLMVYMGLMVNELLFGKPAAMLLRVIQ
ncbi:MAG: chain length-determining protein [Paraglaciecola sp.]|uniref:Chain length-determining protein n=1 Tax=Alishewanella maricola TaxID=2795740 RepID=A0ABS8C375_9ALTE|nr:MULTISPECIES: XrtA system polysaccharide chain length determinant [Alishewanella]MCB5226732.1 chain length-determining protein [Alishewanella maricola]MDP5130619.1 chain length-determining protein [Paraglaciecola sp.]MDP5458143.1 GNVR domain-containing protein [Alishewanella sp. SMS8]